MNISLKKIDDTFIMCLQGDFDIYNSTKVRDFFMRLLSRDIKKIVLDMDNVDYIDSTGVGVLINCFATSKKENVKVCICNVHGLVQRLIDLTRLSQFFTKAIDVNDAVNLLHSIGEDSTL